MNCISIAQLMRTSLRKLVEQEHTGTPYAAGPGPSDVSAAPGPPVSRCAIVKAGPFRASAVP